MNSIFIIYTHIMKTVLALGILASVFFGFAALGKQDRDGSCKSNKISYRWHQIELLKENRTVWVKADEAVSCGAVLILYEKGELRFKDSICHFQVIPKQD